MKIAFFGTSDRSQPILEALKNNFDLVLCVTRADSKVGRKQIAKETFVKAWCKKNDVKFIEIDNFKNSSFHISPEMELAIVADFSFMIPQNVINSFKHGVLNIHFSLLPAYRGASPIQAFILSGGTTTGVTFYLMDKGMDTGNIIHRIEYKTTCNETSGELYKKLFDVAGKTLPEVVSKYLSGVYKPTPQDNAYATYTYSPSHPKNTFIYKEDAKLDFSKDDIYLERCVRAYHPWPIAWATLGELSKKYDFALKNVANTNVIVKIHKTHLDETNKLKIDIIQPQNGKQMDWRAFLNGYVRKI